MACGELLAERAERLSKVDNNCTNTPSVVSSYYWGGVPETLWRQAKNQQPSVHRLHISLISG